MSFTESVKTCFRKTFSYSGRATRAEYWWFQLFIWAVLAAIVGIASTMEQKTVMYTIAVVFYIVTLFPNIAVCCRRLHDRGYSANIFLLCIVIWGLLFVGPLQVLPWAGAIGMVFVGTVLGNLIPGFLLGMVLGCIVPGVLIGLIVINIINMLKSDVDNKYGPNPSI